ncbi:MULTISPECIES: type III secretion system cytoplasmic ring protein SctQ [Paraburkholderia]|uniref:type III secretion system cytoplasmic ring protein SctQ n=1 Tax=Paraburkholderia TaxID=1822464 RepID=UPI000378B0F3|nr:MULTISPECIES: type III secretion system cytoplasmic ring protein SctQ [Paraburkholderia]MDH6146204.1 type III secretion protein Q [Paraburkholderia sp. WSM4179]
MDHPRTPFDTAPTAPAEAAQAQAQVQAPSAVAQPLDAARMSALGAQLARWQRLALDARLHTLLAHTCGVSDWSVGTHDPLAERDVAVVTLRWGLQQAEFALDVAQHAGLASLLAADPDAQPALRRAVGAVLLEPLTAALAQLGMDGVDIVALAPAAAQRGQQPRCALTFRLGARRIDAVLDDLDTEWLEALERLVANQCLPFATHVSSIAVPGRLSIGERSVSVALLDSLRPGDVVLRCVSNAFAALYRGECETARLPVAWGRYGTRQLRALAIAGPQSLTIEEDPVMSHDMQFNAPLTDSIDTPVDISHLDLPLKLEIDTVSLPVAQLSALRAGYVLELPTALPDARVRLVTYGQTIGFGELVSVGDHLGVRLVQLSQPHHGSI